VPPLFGLAPGGVYHAAAVASDAVRSCRTLSTLPALRPRVRRLGGMLSVALSLTPPEDEAAGRYPAPLFRGARTFLASLAQAAAARSPGRGHIGEGSSFFESTANFTNFIETGANFVNLVV
jgi:hypothetical protein